MTDHSSGQPQPWTVGRLLGWTKDFLARKGLEEPRLAAEILLATALECPRIQLYTCFEQVPKPAQLDLFRESVKRAVAHVPIAYLVGKKEFFSLDFEVSAAVLIPRPETEILVREVVDHLRACGADTLSLLDLGTGCGCIVISVLKHVPAAAAVATDISTDALATAERNAAKHGLSERIRFTKADRLDLPADAVPKGGFDLIVSNPPYVAADEVATLDRTVREHEPTGALTDGADGLSFFRTLAGDGPRLLKAAGSIFVEIADGQASAVDEIFSAGTRFEQAGVWRDSEGGHQRVLHFRLKSE